MRVVAVVEVRILLRCRMPVVLSVGLMELIVRNEAVEKERKFPKDAVKAWALRRNAGVHGIVSGDEEAGV